MKGPRKSLSQVALFFLGPVDAIRMRAFELGFVFSFFVYLAARFRYAREWLTPEGFHYTPETKLAYHLDPFPLPPLWGAVLLGGLMGAACVLVFANRYRRIALAILAASAIYIQFADAVAAFTLNKLFIVGFVLLLLSPSMPKDIRTGKIDSAWAFRILQITILVQFFTAGTSKYFGGDWHAHTDVLWTQVQGIYRTDIAAWMLRTLPKSAWTAMQHIALAFELAGPFLLLWKRTRWIGLIWALGFVSLIALTMKQLIYFMLQIVAFLVLFVSARELRWGWAITGDPFSKLRASAGELAEENDE